MGAVILQACEERVALRHATILIHHINAQTVPLDVLEDQVKLDGMRKSMRADQKSIYNILIQRTKKNEDEIGEECKKDKDMTAAEALAFGLIDRIEEYEGDPVVT